MIEKLKEFESYRQEKCKKANVLLYIGIPLLLIGIIISLTEVAPFGFVLVIAGMVLIVINAAIKAKISKEFKTKFIPGIVQSVYPDSVYIPGYGLSKGEILEPGFFKSPDRFYSEDLVKASYNGIDFQMSDFDLQERHETRDKDGHVKVTYTSYAKGRFLIFDFKREFNKTLKVIQARTFGLRMSGLNKVETESIEFNERYYVYSTDDFTAFYILTPQVQLKFIELDEEFKGKLYFAYMRGKFYMAVCDFKSILDINASKKITEKTIDFLNQQLTLPKRVIEKLGLDKTKFNEGESI